MCENDFRKLEITLDVFVAMQELLLHIAQNVNRSSQMNTEVEMLALAIRFR